MYIGRGGVSFPENTIEAFKYAYNQGARMFECDVQITKDDVFILCHDNTIDRTSNGNGIISELTYKEISNYDFGSWLDTKYVGTSILRLDDFLVFCKGKNCFVELDIAERGFTITELEKLYKLVSSSEMLTKTLFTAEYETIESLVKLSEQNLLVSCSGIIDKTKINLTINSNILSKTEVCFVSIPCQFLNEELIDYAHLNGMKVKVWTLNSKADIKEAFHMGSELIISDEIYYYK